MNFKRKTSNFVEILGKNDVINYLKEKLIESISTLDYKEEINELSRKIDDLKLELNKQSKSVLLSENAELRIKMKEKILSHKFYSKVT